MNFNDYQEKARTTAIYSKNYKVIYPTLGLCGESGEIAEKIKKWIRDDEAKELTDEQLLLLKKELGDVLWYISNLAFDLNLKLDDIAELNIEKLFLRKINGTIQGSGDNR